MVSASTYNKNQRYSNKQGGQAIIAGLGLMAVLAVVIYFIFNSGRATNEKLNLVNAADAAAYSGAQITARQMNFMAYTNRAMIANEVAIGHMVSYQAEMDVLADAFTNIGGAVGNVLVAGLDILLAAAGSLLNVGATDYAGAIEYLNNESVQWTGNYILGVSANNARYSEMQALEIAALGSTVQATMEAVVTQYARNQSVQISVNDAATLDYLTDNGYQNIRTGVEANSTGFSGLVQMSTPGADNATLMSLITRTSEAATSSEWINNRNIPEYAMPGIWRLLGLRSSRQGQTELIEQNGSYTWVAPDEYVQIHTPWLRLPIIGQMGIEMEGNVSLTIDDILNRTNSLLLNATGALGGRICSDINCAPNGTDINGYQPINSYAMINPESSLVSPTGDVAAFITAAVRQLGTCNDAIGRHKNGASRMTFGENQKQDWVDNQTRFEDEQPICDPNDAVLAVSSARIAYRKPVAFRDLSDPTAGNEAPNLFNPFWTAILDYADTRPGQASINPAL